MLAGTIISSPYPNPKALTIRVKASNPFATPKEYLVPQYFAKFSQNILFSSPCRYHPLSKIFLILLFISYLNRLLIFLNLKKISSETHLTSIMLHILYFIKHIIKK